LFPTVKHHTSQAAIVHKEAEQTSRPKTQAAIWAISECSYTDYGLHMY